MMLVYIMLFNLAAKMLLVSLFLLHRFPIGKNHFASGDTFINWLIQPVNEQPVIHRLYCHSVCFLYFPCLTLNTLAGTNPCASLCV